MFPSSFDGSSTTASSIIVYGADHNAEWQSEGLKNALVRLGDVLDTSGLEPKFDNYVDICSRVCNLTLTNGGIGVIICGTGIGVSIVANKHKGIYAARCVTPVDAIDCKVINNANVLCLSAKTDLAQNIEIIHEFFATRFEAIDRRMDRVRRINQVENQNFRPATVDPDTTDLSVNRPAPGHVGQKTVEQKTKDQIASEDAKAVRRGRS